MIKVRQVKQDTATLSYNQDNLEKLCKEYGLELVILHGSHATGNLHGESDIDIGILGHADRIRNHYLDLIGDFSELFGDGCDLIVLNNAESMIVYQVAVKGIPIYEAKEGLFAEFKTTAITRYQDAIKFRRLEKKYLKSVIYKRSE